MHVRASINRSSLSIKLISSTAAKFHSSHQIILILAVFLTESGIWVELVVNDCVSLGVFVPSEERIYPASHRCNPFQDVHLCFSQLYVALEVVTKHPRRKWTCHDTSSQHCDNYENWNFCHLDPNAWMLNWKRLGVSRLLYSPPYFQKYPSDKIILTVL